MSSDRERNSCLEAWSNIISQRKCPCWCLYGSAEERVVVMSWECNELKIWPKALSQYLVITDGDRNNFVALTNGGGWVAWWVAKCYPEATFEASNECVV